MAYEVPRFNLLADVWNAGHTPAIDDPDEENVPCQFYLYSRGTFSVDPCQLELYVPPIWLRFPSDRAAVVSAGQVFEVEPESGRYFRARFKEIMHYGFPNQYLIVVVVQCGSDGIPILHDIEGAVACDEAPPGDHVGDGDGAIAAGLIGLGEADNLGQ